MCKKFWPDDTTGEPRFNIKIISKEVTYKRVNSIRRAQVSDQQRAFVNMLI